MSWQLVPEKLDSDRWPDPAQREAWSAAAAKLCARCGAAIGWGSAYVELAPGGALQHARACEPRPASQPAQMLPAPAKLSLAQVLERIDPVRDAEVTPALQRAAHLWVQSLGDEDLELLGSARRFLGDLKRCRTLTRGQARAALNVMRRAAGKVQGSPVRDGTYTVVFPDTGERRTVRLETLSDAATRWPGRQLASYLYGPDNTAHYRAFAVVERDGSLRRTSGAQDGQSLLDEAMRVILRDPLACAKAFGLMSGVCGVCGRPLTVPESIEAGIGPVCAQRF